MIPPLDQDTGYLPPGVHDATVSEVRGVFCGTVRRVRLFAAFEQAVLRPFFAIGIDYIIVGGSFCTSAPMPNDIDALWPYKSGCDLKKVDPVLLNMSAMVVDPSSGKLVRPMKLKYGVELFIESKDFLDFFSVSRDGVARGLLRIVREI